MKRVRIVESIILGIATTMSIYGIISPKKFLCIFFVIILTTVISELYYCIKYKSPFYEIFFEYYYFKEWKKKRFDFDFTGNDEETINLITECLINTGKRIIEKGTLFVNNPRMLSNLRKKVQEIMDEVNKTLETEKP